MRSVILFCSVCIVLACPGKGLAQSLLGSATSLKQQNLQARRHDFTYLHEASQVKKFVNAGFLIQMQNSQNYILKDVSFPFARPQVKLFVERLSRQYRRACNELLVVTSLTRPSSHQPWNASPDSVHPTGMALDLRRPNDTSCRQWLERTLLYLEGRMVLEATLERGPPHYHVAIFPDSYAAYVVGLIQKSRSSVPGSMTHSLTYQVRR